MSESSWQALTNEQKEWPHPKENIPEKSVWIGLTAKDLAEIPPSCYEGAIWADARLKEKNT